MEPTHMRLRDRTVDIDRRIVETGDATYPLSAEEVEVLRHLDANAARFVSMQELAATLGEAPSGVRARIEGLRRKLEVDPQRPAHLVGVRGAGYRLSARADADGPHGPGMRVDAFVGRARSVRTIRQRLHDETLLAVTGEDGVGKTRVVEEVAAGWPGPVVRVRAAGCAGFDELAGRVAAAAGHPRSRAIDALSSSGAQLLVCDGLEAPGAYDGLWEWLGAIPSLCAVVTARDAPEGSDPHGLGPMGDADARRLVAIRAGYAVDTTVDAITRTTARVPLALEIAAMLPPAGASQGCLVLPDGLVDLDRALVTRAAATTRLERQEVRLLRFLVADPREWTPAHEVATHVFGLHAEPRTLRNAVYQLRGKLESRGAQEPVLGFRRDRGYRLRVTLPRRGVREVFASAWSALTSAERKLLTGTAAFAGGFRGADALALTGGDDDGALHGLARAALLGRTVEGGEVLFHHHDGLRAHVEAHDADPERTMLAHLSWVAERLEGARDAPDLGALRDDLHLAIGRCPPSHPTVLRRLIQAAVRHWEREGPLELLPALARRWLARDLPGEARDALRRIAAS